MELNPNNVRRLKELIIFTILIFLGIKNIYVVIDVGKWVLGLLYPFILGSCIAFIINVPMKALEKKLKLKRGLSILLTMTLVLGVIFIVFFLVVPEFGRTFIMLSDSIPGFVVKAEKWVVEFFGRNPEILERITALDMDWQDVIQSVFSFFRTGAGGLINSTLGAAVSIVSSLTTFFIAMIFSIYVLSQKEKLGSQSSKLLYAYLPEVRAERLITIASLISKTFSNFLSGQCIEAVILGLMFFVAMSIFKFPYALMISVLIAFTALIPIFGAFIGSAIGTFLIFMVNPAQAVWFIILFNVLQQIEGNLIYPHVVGGSVGLSPMWVLVAVTLGGNTMGIAGMLIFIPMFSVFYTLLRESVETRLRKKEAAKAEAGSGEKRTDLRKSDLSDKVFFSESLPDEGTKRSGKPMNHQKKKKQTKGNNRPQKKV